MASPVGHWMRSRLGRKLSLSLGGILVVSSLVFLVAFVALYQARLVDERAQASEQVNLLLQASLENAMLKRDLDGLRDVVGRLGTQEGIRSVMILNPAAEVRFSSEAAQLGQRFESASDPACARCHASSKDERANTAFLNDERGFPVLRSVNVVRNREPCTECHGPIEGNPVNGVLIVDYDAAGIKRQALLGALALSGSGGIVLLCVILGVGVLLNRFVLRPVSALADASDKLSQGQLGARVAWRSDDELGRLASGFNAMADRVQTSIDALAHRERFLQSLMDSVPDGIRVIDQDYRIVRANRAYCEQLGRDMAEVVDRPCYDSSHGRSEPCAPTLVTCPLVALRDGPSSIKCRHRHIRANGDEVFVEVTAARMEADEPLVVEAIRDLDQQMRHSQAQRLSEIGQLATGVAHEVRNPLASILLGLDAIQKQLGEDGAGSIHDYIDLVNREIAKCIDVTERLLRLSAPPGEQADLVPLNDVVRDVITLLSFEAEQSDVSVRIALEDDLRVLASNSEMRMVLLNLVQNAFHAMNDGGSLIIEGRSKNGVIRLSLSDTGVGIHPDDIAMIFQPFWSRRADGVEGTGLGLAISHAILQRWGGDIEVTSEVGRGTTFTIRMNDANDVVAGA